MFHFASFPDQKSDFTRGVSCHCNYAAALFRSCYIRLVINSKLKILIDKISVQNMRDCKKLSMQNMQNDGTGHDNPLTLDTSNQDRFFSKRKTQKILEEKHNDELKLAEHN